MKTTLIAVLALTVLSGCATQRVYLDNSDRTSSRDSYEKSQPFFISGLGQIQELDIEQACGKRKATRIETTQTPVDILLGAVTFGIYTPRTVQVYCK